MLLCHATSDNLYCIDHIDLPYHQLQKLQARGIVCGTQLKLMYKRRSGAVIVFCRMSRFALGKYYTSHIHVHTAGRVKH